MPAQPRQDETLLEQINDRYAYAEDEWREIRKEGAKDMRFVAGDPWEPAERLRREELNRPCLALDELGQYFNQAINDVRQNKLGIKFAPIGNGATDKTAEFYQNKVREIEYRSNASLHYIAAFENAIQRGYGYVGLTTTIAAPGSFNQELTVIGFPNPDQVLPDPDALMPDSSDLRYCFVFETPTRKEFLRRFPKATVTDFSADVMKLAPRFFKGDKVVLAAYWTKEVTGTRTLLKLKTAQGPIEVYKDTLTHAPSDEFILDEVDEETTAVTQYLTNGVEILQRRKWRGKYIPIASCYGKVIWVDDGAGVKRMILSMTRLGRDPYMLYCFYRTQQAEMAKMVPKAPVMAYKGQFNGLKNEWARAVDEPMAFLEANAKTPETGEQILPLPVRLEYNAGEHLQSLELAAEGARRGIQAAMAISPLTTPAQRHNEKSGVALQEIRSASQTGAFHFVDHYREMIRHVGVMAEDQISNVYDTARDVGVRKPDDTAETVPINGDGQISTKGDHQTTVSAGPSFESERDAANQFADTIANVPEIFARIGDLVVRLKNLGPIGDEIAERLTPPEFRKPKDGQQVDPQQLAQAAQQAQAQLQECEQALSAAMEDLKTKKVERETQLEIKRLDVAFQQWKVQQESETKITVAELGAKIERIELFLQERERLGLRVDTAAERVHASLEAEADRQHEASMAVMSHDHAIDQGAAGVEGQIAVQAAAPQPEAGA